MDQANQTIHSVNQQRSEPRLTEFEAFVTLMLLESNAAYRLPVLEDEELDLTRASWCRVLQGVPFRFLRRCYERAVQGHAGKFALSAYEVKAIWDHATSSGEAAQWFQEDRKELTVGCDWCNNTDFVRVQKEGRRIKWNDPAESSGVRRCNHG
jgi:hypothetical protein